jgi:FeS assembly SUF system protein
MFRLSRLARQPAPEPAVAAATADAGIEERIVAALRTVYDPEIPVNVYDLGLIYAIDVGADGAVEIRMTLTAPACPVAGMMPGLVESAVRQVDGVTAVRVDLVWDPPWNKERMSDEARLQLGML